MTATQNLADEHAKIKEAWLADNPQPGPRAPLSEVMAWAKRWRQSEAYRLCCEITERLTESQP